MRYSRLLKAAAFAGLVCPALASAPVSGYNSTPYLYFSEDPSASPTTTTTNSLFIFSMKTTDTDTFVDDINYNPPQNFPVVNINNQVLAYDDNYASRPGFLDVQTDPNLHYVSRNANTGEISWEAVVRAKAITPATTLVCTARFIVSDSITSSDPKHDDSTDAYKSVTISNP